jgi:glycine/D-amino acid oxidase-like deaminating enzyme
MKQSYDFLIVGAGIFGITTAIELAKQKYQVAIINPDSIPHPRAASTDISKVVRMEYGVDREYADMAEASIQGWKEWNDLFNDTLYHEVGLLMASKTPLLEQKGGYIWDSYQVMLQKGYQPDHLIGTAITDRFPSWDINTYPEAIFNPNAGYAEAGRAVGVLADYAKQLGVDVFEQQTAATFVKNNNQIEGLKTKEGLEFKCGHVIVCAGAHTPYLLPELQPVMQATGHAVFHILLQEPLRYSPPQFSVFMADVSNTGWYGFPFHVLEGVLKVGHHGIGLPLHPDVDDRLISAEEVAQFRIFLAETFPDLAKAPITYTRRCLYTDTKDGHFWIDQHPEIKGLTIGTGGSGHGFKMGPELGKMIAATALGQAHHYSDRYKWRSFDENTVNVEASRHK